MIRMVIVGLFAISSLSAAVVSAVAAPCASGSCRVERSRTVERTTVEKERHVTRARFFRR